MKIFNGNNLDLLKTLDACSIDSIVTDPPYGLSFMNKKWDHDVPSVEFWQECFRVLKPGGHVLSFGGTRTYHRMAVNIEDAGFEIRDQIMWLYGSGFPKSHNISKGIDKKLGCEREVVGISENNRDRSKHNYNSVGDVGSNALITKPSSDQAKQWDGFGTALKPANEPIVLARKPLSEKTIVDNVLKWGTGALNIDGCRVEFDKNEKVDFSKIQDGNIYGAHGTYGKATQKKTTPLFKQNGRWPANVILDEEAAQVLDEQSGVLKSGAKKQDFETAKTQGVTFKFGGGGCESSISGASRFFYVAKASKSERNRGLEGMPSKFMATMGDGIGKREYNENQPSTYNQNFHPTVKPIKLMEYLVKLITPPNGTVLDPFMGSGSTGIACKNLGFKFIGMELDQEYFEIAKKRIENK